MRGSLDAVTLKSGTNATIALVYERDDSDREDADVTVNYYYTDYYMTIVDGKAVYLRDERARAGHRAQRPDGRNLL